MKNLACYPERHRLGSIDWFKVMTAQLSMFASFIGKHSGEPEMVERCKQFALSIHHIAEDLDEWRQAGKPLFDDVAYVPNVESTRWTTLEAEEKRTNAWQEKFDELNASFWKWMPDDSSLRMAFPDHGHIYKVSTDGSIPIGFVPEPQDDSNEIRKAMISHLTCTEVKENNSLFLIHKPGNAF